MRAEATWKERRQKESKMGQASEVVHKENGSG